MSEHTPGLLALEEVVSDSGHIKHLRPVDGEGMSLLTVVEHEGVKFAAVYNDDDARRFVAAWNACEGITTERLEDLGRPLMAHLIGCDERAHRQVKEADSLRAVNAELLEALESMLEQFNFSTITGIVHDESSAITNANAAIASARKQGEQG